MTAQLPIIDALSSARDHSARARWLLRVPELVLSRDHDVIRKLLVAAEFRDGLIALNAEIAAASAVRDEGGAIPQRILLAREYARIGLKIIARGDAIDTHKGAGS